MTTVTIVLTVPTTQATMQDKMKLVPGFSPHSFNNIGKYFEAIGGGTYAGKAVVTIGAASPVTVYNGQA